MGEGMKNQIRSELTGKPGRADLPRVMPFWGRRHPGRGRRRGGSVDPGRGGGEVEAKRPAAEAAATAAEVGVGSGGAGLGAGSGRERGADDAEGMGSR
jgi:hypothetical protein